MVPSPLWGDGEMVRRDQLVLQNGEGQVHLLWLAPCTLQCRELGTVLKMKIRLAEELPAREEFKVILSCQAVGQESLSLTSSGKQAFSEEFSSELFGILTGAGCVLRERPTLAQAHAIISILGRFRHEGLS